MHLQPHQAEVTAAYWMYISSKFSRATQNSVLVYYPYITHLIFLLPFSNPCAKIATCKSSSCELEKLLSEQNLVLSYFWTQDNQGNVVTPGINWELKIYFHNSIF